jgi:hypothetical protein
MAPTYLLPRSADAFDRRQGLIGTRSASGLVSPKHLRAGFRLPITTCGGKAATAFADAVMELRQAG